MKHYKRYECELKSGYCLITCCHICGGCDLFIYQSKRLPHIAGTNMLFTFLWVPKNLLYNLTDTYNDLNMYSSMPRVWKRFLLVSKESHHELMRLMWTHVRLLSAYSNRVYHYCNFCMYDGLIKGCYQVTGHNHRRTIHQYNVAIKACEMGNDTQYLYRNTGRHFRWPFKS